MLRAGTLVAQQSPANCSRSAVGWLIATATDYGEGSYQVCVCQWAGNHGATLCSAALWLARVREAKGKCTVDQQVVDLYSRALQLGAHEGVMLQSCTTRWLNVVAAAEAELGRIHLRVSEFKDVDRAIPMLTAAYQRGSSIGTPALCCGGAVPFVDSHVSRVLSCARIRAG